MSRCIWKIERELPELKAGMVVQYNETSKSAYLLLDIQGPFQFHRTIRLDNLQSNVCDYSWPTTKDNLSGITKIWASIDDYYKDKFNV